MRGASEFLDIVHERETALMQELLVPDASDD
jgi:hypothetical protein